MVGARRDDGVERRQLVQRAEVSFDHLCGSEFAGAHRRTDLPSSQPAQLSVV
jgi:hypothetical protein